MTDEKKDLGSKIETGELKRSLDGLPKMKPGTTPIVEAKPAATKEIVTESLKDIQNMAPVPTPPEPKPATPPATPPTTDKSGS